MNTNSASDPFAAQKALIETLDKSGWDLIVGDAFVPESASSWLPRLC